MKSVIVTVIFVSGALIFAAFALLIAYHFAGNRRERISTIAKQNNWRFVERMDRKKMFGNEPSIPKETLTNVIVRKEQGCIILFFDYAAGRYGASRIMTISETLRIPQFTITPRGKFRLSMQPEILLPYSQSFSASVKVHSNNENGFRQVLTPAVVNQLGRIGRFWLDANGRSFFSDIIVGGRIPVNSIKLLLDQHAFIHWALMHRTSGTVGFR